MRDALDAVAIGYPCGEVLPVQVLQQRVTSMYKLERQCRFQDVGRVLPVLIRDLPTALAAGRDLATLLPLTVLLHVRVTRTWLNSAEAPTDLRRQAMFLARDLAPEHNDAASLLAVKGGDPVAPLAPAAGEALPQRQSP